MQLEPAILIVAPLIFDAVANNRVLGVAKAVGLILAICFPFHRALLVVVLDLRSDSGVLWISCDTKLTAGPFLLASGTNPYTAILQ